MNTKISIAPLSRYDLGGWVQYLEKMASRGWFISRVFFPFCFFKFGPVPSSIHYRLEPLQKESEPSPTLLELYESAQWQYITKIDGYFLFASNASDPQEPYSDPESMNDAMERLFRSERSYMRRNIAVIAVYALLLCVAIFMLPTQTILILSTLPLVGYLWLICNRLDSINDYRTLRRIRLGLSDGIYPSTGKLRRGLQIRNLLYSILTLVVLIYVIRWVFLPRFLPGVLPSPDMPKNVFSIEELEEIYPVQLEEDSITIENNAPTLFLPYGCSVVQNGLAETEVGDPYPRVNDHYHPMLKTAVFRLTIPSTARAIAKAQMDFWHTVNEDWQYKETTYPGTDFVILGYVENSASQLCAISSGGKLVVYSYHGAERLEDQLELLTTPIQ